MDLPLANGLSWGWNEVDKNQDAQLADIALDVKFPQHGLSPAKGDGTTDDTAAIQAIINYVKNNGGGTIFFPIGTYIITSPLLIDTHYVNLRGTGVSSKIINNGTGNAITINPGTTVTPMFCTISDMWIVGNPSSAHGIYVTYAYNVTLRDLYLNGHGGDGVYSLFGMNSVMERVRSDENSHGFSLNQIDAGHRSTTWTLIDCYFGSNNNLGGLLSGGDSNVLIKCLFEGNKGNGLYITNDEVNPNLHSCYFESNTGYSVNIDSGREGYVFGGRFADTNVSAHIQLGNTKGWLIQGTWHDGNATGGGVNINKSYSGGVDLLVNCSLNGSTPVSGNTPNLMRINTNGISALKGISATQISANNLRGIGKSVTANTTSVTVTFSTPEPDVNYSITALPSWNTTYWIPGGNKTANGFTIIFGTASASAETFDWHLIR